MRVLFVSERLLWKNTGAEKVSKNLLQTLVDIVGEKNLEVISFSKEENKNIYEVENFTIYEMYKSPVKKLYNKLNLNAGGINKKSLNTMLSKIELNKYSYIFLDSSEYGKLSKKIKQRYPDIKIMVFFHDVNKFWLKSMIRSSNNIKEKVKVYLQYPAYIYNEKETVKNSDICITLNKRDGDLINKEYRVVVENNIPVTIKDSFENNRKVIENSDEINILFVGAYYLPNVQGIKWFIKEVLPYINANLTIVGNGMEQIKYEIKNDNVEILGFVDDLGEYYYKANCVVAPIFDGGGMKVKVAEALMYGKTIFATTEALEGYDFEAGKMGERCDSSQEFISEINYYIKNQKMSPFNESSRLTFINKYDYALGVKKMKSILESNK